MQAPDAGRISRKNLLAIGWGLGIWSALFLTTAWLLPLLQLPDAASLWLSAVLCFAGVFFVYWQLLSVRQSRGAWVASVAASGLLSIGFFSFKMQPDWSAFFHSLFLVVFAFCAGRFMATLVDEKAYLVPVAVVASAGDLWSVFKGLSKQLAESDSPLVQAVTATITVSIPVASGTGAERPIKPIAGGTDFIFIAFFLAISSKFGLPLRRSAVFMFVGLLAGLSLVILLQRFRLASGGLPGLPFLAAAYVAAHWTDVRPAAKEIKILLVFCAVGGVILGLITWMS